VNFPYSIVLQLLMVHQDDDACTLVRELDGLPLALATAGAYLYQVSTSFADYVRLYNASWLRLQQKTPELLSYEDRALYSTWNISLDHVKEQSLPAFKLLQLWAYFDNQDVWFELLRECQQDGPEWFSQLMEDQLSFDKAVRVLCEHALVEADFTLYDERVESLGYSMHSCVHSWTKHVVNQFWDSNMARLVLCCVGLHVPDRSRPQYWGIDQRLVGHANQCQEYLGRRLAEQDDDVVMLRAIHGLGILYVEQGKLDEAEEMYRRALAGFEKALGRNHTLTLDTVNNLGILYVEQGKLDEAEEMYRRALAGFEKALGRDHTSTLSTVNNLGLLYVHQGKLDKAEEMYQRALAGKKKALGRDHMSTLNTVNNLGLLYGRQGKLDKAEEMYLRALAGFEKALGRDHMSTLNTVNNLGLLYFSQGKLGEAEEMCQRALAGKEKALRRNHTSTLSIVNNLGNLYVNQGKLDEAKEMYQWALAGKEKTLGRNHLSTLDTVNNLGILYRRQGKLDEAEEMYRWALTGYEKHLGLEHVRCRRLRKSLASLENDIASR
jgi:tetratricopeptide (TPR) repeat protein